MLSRSVFLELRYIPMFRGFVFIIYLVSIVWRIYRSVIYKQTVRCTRVDITESRRQHSTFFGTCYICTYLCQSPFTLKYFCPSSAHPVSTVGDLSVCWTCRWHCFIYIIDLFLQFISKTSYKVVTNLRNLKKGIHAFSITSKNLNY